MSHASLVDRSGPTWLAVASLWRREVVRFVRQRSRVVGALATPIVFWLLLGLGLGRSFVATGAAAGHGYLQYFFPGTLVMIVLFSSIFSTISLIEDRREGFLQAVLAAPVSRSALVLGNTLGGATLAFGQAVILLVGARFIGFQTSLAEFAGCLGLLAVLAFGLTCLGFAMAWRMTSIQGFHAIMNLFLVPMWMLSGAVFPASGAPPWLHRVMMINPLTYGVAGVRRSLGSLDDADAMGLPSAVMCWSVTTVFAVIMFAVCLRQARRRDVSP